MKICLVNHEFIPLRGSGQVVYAEHLARALAKDHDVTVVTALRKNTKATERIDRIRVLRIPVNNRDSSLWLSFSFRVAGFLRELNRTENFDVVHFLDCHLAHRYKDPFVATLFQSFRQRISSNSGLPYFSSILNLLMRYPYYNFAQKLESRAARQATTLLASSHATKAEFVTHYSLNDQDVRVVHLGIDSNFFKPANGTEVRRLLGVDGKKVLLYVGFSTPRKGLKYLLQAMQLLKNENAVLLIIGRWETGYRESLEDLIIENNSRVIEVGYVSDEEMPQYYNAADLLVMPSLLEGFGYPLAESMACGTPVIGTSAGSIPEVVGDFGVIVPPMDAKALAEAIDSELGNDNEEISREALITHVQESFSINSMISNTLAVYDAHLNRLAKQVR